MSHFVRMFVFLLLVMQIALSPFGRCETVYHDSVTAPRAAHVHDDRDHHCGRTIEVVAAPCGHSGEQDMPDHSHVRQTENLQREARASFDFQPTIPLGWVANLNVQIQPASLFASAIDAVTRPTPPVPLCGRTCNLLL